MSPKERLQALCEANGISITGLEKKLGLGLHTLLNWDKTDPKITTAKKVADYFGVSVAYLMGWESEIEDREAILEHLARDEELKAFMMTASKCTPDELKALEGMIKAWKKSLD